MLFLLICFTSGKKPIPGYESPHDSSYYSQNDVTLSELKSELEKNVFPYLKGITDSRVSNGKLVITIESDSYSISRSALLKYYDVSLFEFVQG